MASIGLQLVGYILGLLGLLGTLIAMLLPSWRTSSYVGASIVTAVGFSKGLWMECATHSTGITQCDIYSTMLGLPADIQAAQAMMVTSSAMSSLACIVSVVGMRCTVFFQESRAKDRVAVVGGVFFILGGLLGFIPVAWNLHGILRDFYSPLVPDSMKFEIGEALYLGIISSLFSLVAGIFLCFSCSPQGNRSNYYDAYQAQPLATRSSPRPGQAPKGKSEFNSYSLTGGGGGQNWLLGGKMNSNFPKDLHSASQTVVQPALQLASYQLPSYLVVGNVLKPLTVTRVNKAFLFSCKRHLLLGKKVMTNLDSLLKSRDITLPTKVRLVKAMVFPVVMHGCVNWTIKKAERRRIDAFEQWCWRRLWRVPRTARRSNHSILKEISPECSLEGLMLKLKLQYFGHLMQRTDSFEKTLMLGKTEGGRRRG